jgi:hypothetical protein
MIKPEYLSLSSKEVYTVSRSSWSSICPNPGRAWQRERCPIRFTPTSPTTRSCTMRTSIEGKTLHQPYRHIGSSWEELPHPKMEWRNPTLAWQGPRGMAGRNDRRHVERRSWLLGDQSGVWCSTATRGPIRIFSTTSHLHLLHARVHRPSAGVAGARADHRIPANEHGVVPAPDTGSVSQGVCQRSTLRSDDVMRWVVAPSAGGPIPVLRA